MKLTVAVLKSILNELDDDVVLATLDYGNGDFKTFSWIKRLLLLEDKVSGKKYLTINGMGSHFTGKGEQSHLKYIERYWDEDIVRDAVKPACVSCDEEKETHNICMDCIGKLIKENSKGN